MVVIMLDRRWANSLLKDRRRNLSSIMGVTSFETTASSTGLVGVVAADSAGTVAVRVDTWVKFVQQVAVVRTGGAAGTRRFVGVAVTGGPGRAVSAVGVAAKTTSGAVKTGLVSAGSIAEANLTGVVGTVAVRVDARVQGVGHAAAVRAVLSLTVGGGRAGETTRCAVRVVSAVSARTILASCPVVVGAVSTTNSSAGVAAGTANSVSSLNTVAASLASNSAGAIAV
jgi:hypothetical protein